MALRGSSPRLPWSCSTGAPTTLLRPTQRTGLWLRLRPGAYPSPGHLPAISVPAATNILSGCQTRDSSTVPEEKLPCAPRQATHPAPPRYLSGMVGPTTTSTARGPPSSQHPTRSLRMPHPRSQPPQQPAAIILIPSTWSAASTTSWMAMSGSRMTPTQTVGLAVEQANMFFTRHPIARGWPTTAMVRCGVDRGVFLTLRLRLIFKRSCHHLTLSIRL